MSERSDADTRLRARAARFLNRPLTSLTGRHRALGLVLVGAVLLTMLGTVALVAMMMLSWTNVALASRPGACASCHEVAPAHEQWVASTHKEVGCLSCHAEPNMAGFMKINVSSVTNVVKHLTDDYEMPLRADVKDSSCLQCHTRESRPEELPQASLRIAHSRHENQQCADCHGRLVHQDAEEIPIQATRNMPTASSSHDAQPKDCQVCHPSPQPTYVHGNASLACSSCHSASIPRHDLAVSQGIMARQSCQECHSKLRVVGSPQECNTCHISPHGIDEKVELTCANCHTSQTTWTVHQLNHPMELKGKHAEAACVDCHTQLPTRAASAPGPEKKAEDGAKVSAVTCNTCHQPPANHFGTDCAQCHQAGEKFKMK